MREGISLHFDGDDITVINNNIKCMGVECTECSLNAVDGLPFRTLWCGAVGMPAVDVLYEGECPENRWCILPKANN